MIIFTYGRVRNTFQAEPLHVKPVLHKEQEEVFLTIVHYFNIGFFAKRVKSFPFICHSYLKMAHMMQFVGYNYFQVH